MGQKLKDVAVSFRSFVFHPFIVLLVSIIGAGLYSLYAALRFSGVTLPEHLFYVVPIVIPFIAFLLDRAERLRQPRILQLVVDALVVGTALGRVIGNVPLVSGHTLFLTYCVFSSRAIVPRITAAIVLLQVIYLKYIVWHDWVTSTSGIVLGTLAAFLVWWFTERGELG